MRFLTFAGSAIF